MLAKKKVVFFLVFTLCAAGLAGIGYVGVDSVFGGLPGMQELSARLAVPSVRIEDRNGRLLYEWLPEEGGRHSVVPLEAIPLALQQATIATEDSSFYSNPGVDPRGVLRALWINLQGGETLSGGSTITQQVARNLLLSPQERGERSLRRKLRESLLAWRLTRQYSKEDILALYLNQTYYGGMAYGAEAAAHTFFGKPAAQLDLAESALLAGLPQAPALYNPFTHPDAALKRRGVVLGLMEKNGAISTEQRALAEREPLNLASTPYPMQAPHFVMMVRSQLDALFSSGSALGSLDRPGGLVVRTSLDLDDQGIAERAIQRQIQAMKKDNNGLGHNLNSAALVAMDPQTGEILAMVGSPDYFDGKNGGAINMALAPRQPGSALKPLVYAAAFDPAQPQPWTAATMLLDVSTSFLTHEGKAYTPANYDQREHGPVLARQALASSLNIPAVLTLDHVGLKNLFQLSGKLGITTFGDPKNYDLSLALGGGEVRLLELTGAYGAFANGGYRLNPVAILEIRDLRGKVLYEAPRASKLRVLDERVAWLISDILSDNDARTLGFGPNSVLRLDRPAAVKTGTTTNFHDNWTVGYTPQLVVGVWAGNTDYQPMREVNGLTGAAPVWHEFMRAALAGKPVENFIQPPGMVQVEVCELSGLLPTSACPYRSLEWFIQGTQPSQKDSLYQTVTLDRATGRLADSSTPSNRKEQKTVLDLPPQAQPWARAQGLTLLSDLQLGTEQASGGEFSPLQLTSPAGGSIYRIASTFDEQAQQIPVEAVGEAGLKEVTLWVDGVEVQGSGGSGGLGSGLRSGAGEQGGPFTAWWKLEPGVHQAWAEGVRSDGSRVESERVQFEVIW